MPLSRLSASVLMLVCVCADGLAQQAIASPDAATIMAKVAANQDRTDAERSHYIYVQHAHVISRKGKTVMCEETTDSRITPSAKGSDEQMLKLDGRFLRKGMYVPYTALPTKKADSAVAPNEHEPSDVSIRIDTGDESTDVDLVEGIRSGLIHDKSKDGIGAGLFPLTTKVQAGYLYRLIGHEHLNGREVFHISFYPKDKDDYGWKGDAYIDTTAYQPVVVRTTMARKIPFAVRTLMGTSLPGLGFTVVYEPMPSGEPQPGGLWFPVSFGTEFKLHVLFFFNRQIILDARNHDFEATHVHSTIVPVP